MHECLLEITRLHMVFKDLQIPALYGAKAFDQRTIQLMIYALPKPSVRVANMFNHFVIFDKMK